jgi:hypothetical protein
VDLSALLENGDGTLGTPDAVAEFKKIYRQFFPFGDPSQFADYVFNVRPVSSRPDGGPCLLRSSMGWMAYDRRVGVGVDVEQVFDEDKSGTIEFKAS